MVLCKLAALALMISASFTLSAASAGASSMPHKLAMIPGPIEFHEDVLAAMATPATSHLDPGFINIFGETIEMLRRVLFTTTGQPFIVAGSGTLGWDMVAANLVEPGEQVLVLNTGYFGNSFAETFEAYGSTATQLRSSAPGAQSALEDVVAALKARHYKVITITHVDTSTAVLQDVKALAAAVHVASPDTLIVVDAVCSAGAEELRMDDWGLDVIMTASQKALGAPPGLSVTLVSQRALGVLERRKVPVNTYFASLRRWLPVHKAYEARTGAYFATPPVQSVYALHTSLKMILAAGSMEERFAQHVAVSERVKSTVESWGLTMVPASRSGAAHTLTAIYYPEGVTTKEFLPRMLAQNVIVAGGLLPEISAKYFRVGHMGLSSTDESRGHIDITLAAVRVALEGVMGSALPGAPAAGREDL